MIEERNEGNPLVVMGKHGFFPFSESEGRVVYVLLTQLLHDEVNFRQQHKKFINYENNYMRF